MARGRRGDAPAVQAAKGFPGRRKASVKARIAQAEKMAEQIAAAPHEGDDVLAPPVFLTDPLARPALEVWKAYAPELRRTQRLGPLHRLHFAMFCVYMGEWMTASEDIRKNGAWQLVPTVSGGAMERTRPVVQWREIAYGNALDLGQRFGLTPREEYALFRDQSDAIAKNPGLFAGQGGGQRPAHEGEAAAPTQSGTKAVIGSLSALDSRPPGSPVQ